MRLLAEKGFETVRYEVQIAVDPDSYEPEIRAEKALFKRAAPENLARQLAFPRMRPLPASILSAPGKGQRLILNKVPGGNDNFYSES